jgi:hypothetical protein
MAAKIEKAVFGLTHQRMRQIGSFHGIQTYEATYFFIVLVL